MHIQEEQINREVNIGKKAHIAARISPAFKATLLFLFVIGSPVVGGAAFLYAGYYFDVDSFPPNVLATAMIGGILVGLALVPSILFSAAIGFLATDFMTTVLLVCFVMFGATYLGIFLFNFISSDLAEKLFSKQQKWRDQYVRFKNIHPSKLLGLVFLSRLSPHMPFAATNLVISQLRLKILPATVVSWLGLLPRSLAAASIGFGLGSFSDLSKVELSPEWALFSGILLLFVLGWVFKALRSRKKIVSNPGI